MQMDSRSDADVLEEAKGCPIHQLNPMHPALLKQPWGMNSRLRQEAPIFQDPGGEHAPPFFGTLGGGKFLCAPPKKWGGGTKSAKPKGMGGKKFHDFPPISSHFPPYF